MSTNPRGEAVVKIDGGEYTLAYTIGACSAIEQAFPGKALNAILADLGTEEAPKMHAIQVVVWAGLRKHHNLSLEAVGDLIGMHEIGLWVEGMNGAMGAGGKAADQKRP